MQAEAKSTAASHDHHATNNARSAGNLRAARERAAKKSKYDSAAVRAELARLFRETWGYDARDWQLDITEAILLGLDCLLIAGTGAGKTMPFMLPLKYDARGTILVISPLKILQQDQADRFKVAGIPAVPVNEDTWSDIKSDLEAQKFRAILTSPEMCLESAGFRKFLASPEFQRNLRAVAIDEAHCITQWGGDFRKHYAMLHKVRSLFPARVPFLAATATLPPKARDEVCTELHIDLDDAFFLNLGNDRPNITQEVRFVDSAHDYAALADLLPTNATTPDEIPKTIIFVNSRIGAQEAAREIRALFPSQLQDHIDYLHAIRTGSAKRRIMQRFREGKIRILIATEAAGMGADIPDVMLVIQLGIPGSLAIYLQRAGRAVRVPTLQGRAIILAEKSAFTLQNKRQTGRDPKSQIPGEPPPSAEPEDALEGAADEGTTAPGRTQVWGKQCDPVLRDYITSKVCRRTVMDLYFDNPSRQQPPSGACCDICEGIAPVPPNEELNNDANKPVAPPPPLETPTARSQDPSANTQPPSSPADDAPERPITPTRPPQATPANSPRKNNKRPMVPKEPARRDELLKRIRQAIKDWRLSTRKRDYLYSTLPKEALMTDKVLAKLASDKSYKTVPDLARLDPPWPYASKYGEAVLAVIHQTVDDFVQERDRNTRARRAEKSAETQARKAREREEKAAEKAAAKAAAKRAKEEEKAAQAAEKARAKEQRAREKAARNSEREAKAARRAATSAHESLHASPAPLSRSRVPPSSVTSSVRYSPYPLAHLHELKERRTRKTSVFLLVR
ncbi:P-loop containing nucleoside triphosphate hydrolase protein [Schizophyllum commune]